MSNFENTGEVSNLEAATLLPPGNSIAQNKPLTDVRGSGTATLPAPAHLTGPGPAHSTGSGQASSRSKRKGNALLDYIPLWQRISGLRTETMDELDYEERLIGLRKLMAAFERMLREELNFVFSIVKNNAPCVARIANKDGKDSGQGCPRSIEEQPIAGNHLSERTFLWDPLPKICLKLGISRSALSRLSKEFSGMAAHEVMDRIRVETVKAAMLKEIKLHCMNVFSYVVANGSGKNLLGARKAWPPRTFRFAFYDALNRSRVAPAFDRTTWAISFGFPNYARFRRACLLRFGMTPQQIELELIGESEAILEAEAAEWAKRNVGDDDPEPRPVADTPEWMAWHARRLQIVASKEKLRQKAEESLRTPFSPEFLRFI